MKLWFGVALVILLSGCTAQYTSQVYQKSMQAVSLKQAHQSQRGADWVLPQHAPLAMAMPVDHQQQARASLAFKEALQKHSQQLFPRLVSLDTPLSLEDASYLAFAKGCALMIYPRFHGAENKRDDLNEMFEGKTAHHDKKLGRDATRIELLIVDTYRAQILDSVTVESRAAFFKSPDEQAFDLLDTAVETALLRLASTPTYSGS